MNDLNEENTRCRMLLAEILLIYMRHGAGYENLEALFNGTLVEIKDKWKEMSEAYLEAQKECQKMLGDKAKGILETVETACDKVNGIECAAPEGVAIVVPEVTE